LPAPLNGADVHSGGTAQGMVLVQVPGGIAGKACSRPVVPNSSLALTTQTTAVPRFVPFDVTTGDPEV